MDTGDTSVSSIDTLSPDTKQFLNFLGNTSVECFMFMKPGSKDVIQGLGTWFGTHEDFQRKCKDLTEAGIEFEPHITLNITDLKGRRRSNIQAARVLCCDLDEPISEERLGELIEALYPSLVVETSEGRYHLYWRCVLSLNDWQLAQGALALKLNGDLNLIDLHKTIRVPGFSRITKSGESFIPKIVHSAEHEDVEELSEHLKELGEKAINYRKERNKELSNKATKMIDSLGAGLGANLGAGELGKEGLAAVAEVPSGERNSSLYKLCKQYVVKGNGHITEESTLEFALNINSGFREPLDDEEVERTALSAFNAGEEYKAKRLERQEARAKEAREAMATHEELVSAGGGTVSGTGPFQYDYTTEALSLNRFTDAALVERVLQRFNGHIVRTGRLLYAFDERSAVWRTQKENREILHDYVDKCCVDTMADPQFIPVLVGMGENAASKLRRAQTDWSSNSKRFSCVSKLMQYNSFPRMEISDFDKDPYKFYCLNGALDLITGEIKEATAHDYLLRQSSIVYDPAAECPYFINLLSEIFAENSNPEGMMAFVQEMFGYSLTGSTAEQVMFIHHGEGSNGKSRVLSILGQLMGDYATLMQPTALAKKATAITSELNRIGAKIEGKRVVIVDDLDTKTQWNEGIVKNLTSDRIVARNLFEEEKDIPNRAKMHIGCNVLPSVEASNHAIHRRIVVIRYERQFEVSASKLAEINTNIREELSGILNWAIEGLRRSIEQGITYPQEVRASMEDYEAESSVNTVDLGNILRDLIEPCEEEEHTLQEIYRTMVAHNPSAREVSLSQIGVYLTRIMAFEPKRVQKDKKRTRVYKLRFKSKPLI